MKIKGILMIFFCICAAFYLCVTCTGSYIRYNYPELIDGVKKDFSENTAESESNDIAGLQTQTVSESTVSSDTASTPSVIDTAGGQALGKITAQFLSPYTANTHFNKVYLKNNTGTEIDIEKLYKRESKIKIEKNGEPQVLLVHTHTTESYMLSSNDYYTEQDDPRNLDSAKNMIAIGNIFEEKLKNAGIGTVHDTTVHDSPAYTGSYDRARETILKNLDTYPSIKIILDIHRDSISGTGSEKIKPVADINGTRYAQVMLVMGSETGSVTNFPKWQENLNLAVKYQQTLEAAYPGLARSLTLNSGKYNENISIGSMLIEVGGEANTLDEAKRSAGAAADALVMLLNTLK